MRGLILALLLLPTLAPTSACAEPLRVWAYGDGLLAGGEGGAAAWLDRLARAGGREVALVGASGDLAALARNLPPEPVWSAPEGEPAWDGTPAFRMVPWDAVILAPQDGLGSGPEGGLGEEALAQAARILDWTANQTDARLLVAARPEEAARLAPDTGRRVEAASAGPVLAALRAGPPLDALPPEALAEGSPAAALLTAMVLHAVLWGEAPVRPNVTPDLDPAASREVEPLLRNFDALAARVAALAGVVPETPAPADPSLGLNLAGISDWSTEHPFLDLMRSARPWVGHEPGRWGAWDNARLAAGGYLGAGGFPLALPPGVDRLETFVLTDQPEAGDWLAGTYVLRWKGGASVDVVGRAENVRRGDREVRFDYRPGEGLVAVAVTALDPDDPLRAMTLVREDRLELWEAGALFEPRFLHRVRGVRALRFMDWMATNNSAQVEWADRPRMEDFTWASHGVPVEAMVRLANEAGADPWFTLPHMGSDAYAEAFATTVRDHLDPRLRVHAEWSNEVWNHIFGQAAWAGEQARARWGEDAPGDAWMQWAGLRAAEVAEVWARAFAGEPGRLVRVVGVQTGWLGLEEPLLDAPLAVAEGRAPPFRSFDAYAVTGYFGHALGSPETASDLRAWIADGTAAARATEVARAEVATLRDELWPHHRDAAERRGLRLVAYEAGPHAVGQGEVVDDEGVTSFLTTWSYSEEVGALQSELVDAWEVSGGTLLMPFVDVAPPSKWGSWGALRHLDDQSPRWDALMAANARMPAWEQGRAAAFADGLSVRGTPGPDVLGGSPEEDVVLAGAGDDVVAVEGGDVVDGGAGRDAAALPGARAEWEVAQEGSRTLLSRGWVTVRLAGVEEARFASGEVLALEGAAGTAAEGAP